VQLASWFKEMKKQTQLYDHKHEIYNLIDKIPSTTI
jgi:hypothetical protein